MSVLDTLKAATPSRRTVTICLDGALQAEWDAVVDELQDAAKADANSLAANHTGDVVDKLDEIRDRMAASEVRFVFQQMPWNARVALQADHAPRKGNLADQINGFNLETFYPALVKACCVEVKGADDDTLTVIPDEVWTGLLGTEDAPGSLNTAQFNTLYQAAKAVNDGETSVPPSARSLLGNRDSGASLAQPEGGQDRPRNDSAGGNPPGSTQSSASPTSSTPGEMSAPEVPSSE